MSHFHTLFHMTLYNNSLRFTIYVCMQHNTDKWLHECAANCQMCGVPLTHFLHFYQNATLVKVWEDRNLFDLTQGCGVLSYKGLVEQEQACH